MKNCGQVQFYQFAQPRSQIARIGWRAPAIPDRFQFFAPFGAIYHYAQKVSPARTEYIARSDDDCPGVFSLGAPFAFKFAPAVHAQRVRIVALRVKIVLCTVKDVVSRNRQKAGVRLAARTSQFFRAERIRSYSRRR